MQFSRIRFLGCTHIRADLYSYPLQGPVFIALSEVGSCLPDPVSPARVSFRSCVLPSGPSPCGWLSQPRTTMPDKTPRKHTAVASLPGCSLHDDSTRTHAVSGLITLTCPNTVGFVILLHPGAYGASRVLERLSSCMPRPEDSGGSPHPSHCGWFVLPSSRLRLSASASWPVEAVPELQGARPPLRPTGFSVYACPVSCSQVTLLRNGTNTRYGRAANPYPTGTLTRQETPSFARRYDFRAGGLRHLARDWRRWSGSSRAL